MSDVVMLQCEACTFQFAQTPKMTNTEVAKICLAHRESYHDGDPVMFATSTYSNAVQAMEMAGQIPTAPLEEFIVAYFEDDNIWWRIDCGHHMNLFDAAVERIRELEEALRAHENRPG